MDAAAMNEMIDQMMTKADDITFETKYICEFPLYDYTTKQLVKPEIVNDIEIK